MDSYGNHTKQLFLLFYSASYTDAVHFSVVFTTFRCIYFQFFFSFASHFILPFFIFIVYLFIWTMFIVFVRSSFTIRQTKRFNLGANRQANRCAANTQKYRIPERTIWLSVGKKRVFRRERERERMATATEWVALKDVIYATFIKMK